MKKSSIVIVILALAALTLGCPPPPATKTPEQVRPKSPQGQSAAQVLDEIETQLKRLEEMSQSRGNKPFLDESQVYTFNLDNAPAEGPENAKLQLVVFSDFQCPYCRRFAQGVAELRERFPDDIRLYFMNFPLHMDCNPALSRPMHSNACVYAEAALAANEQGKFWPLHDYLFENQRTATLDSIVEFANSQGMDGAAIRQAVETSKYRDVLKDQARQLLPTNSRGTPTVFINGMKAQGVRWDDVEASAAFIQDLISPPQQEQESGAPKVVDKPDSLPAAEIILDDGTRLEDRLNDIKERIEQIGQAPQNNRPVAKAPDPNQRFEFKLDNRPALGPAEAPVTIVAFVDLQAPQTEIILPVLRQLVESFPGKLRVVVKLFPGRGRNLVREVNEAAIAAAAQGKFWDVVDQIVKQRDSLTVEGLRAIMEKAGLDLAKYDQALAKHEGRTYLVEDFKDARNAMVRTAPALFVNGKSVGAMDPQKLAEAVKAELEGNQ